MGEKKTRRKFKPEQKAASRSTFFSDVGDAVEYDLNTRADGTTPLAGETFDREEFLAEGFLINVDSLDPSAYLMWTGNPISGSNFLGLHAISPVGFLTLRRTSANLLSGLAFSDCQ